MISLPVLHLMWGIAQMKTLLTGVNSLHPRRRRHLHCLPCRAAPAVTGSSLLQVSDTRQVCTPHVL